MRGELTTHIVTVIFSPNLCLGTCDISFDFYKDKNNNFIYIDKRFPVI